MRKEAGEARPRSGQVVQQRRDRHRPEDRHRDHDLRAQHLQVLRRLPAHAGRPPGGREGPAAGRPREALTLRPRWSAHPRSTAAPRGRGGGLVQCALLSARGPGKRRLDAALRRHDLRQRVPAVPGPADRSRSRSCRGSAARRPCGPRASCSSRRRCSLGYAYADWTVRKLLAARAQVQLHVALLVLSLAVLPIVPGARWKPAGDENPIVADPRPARGDRSACPTSCCRRRARWCRPGSRAASPARARTGCSRCRISRRCSRCSAIRSCSSRGSPTRVQALGWSGGYVAVRRRCARPPAGRACAARAGPRRRGWQTAGADLPPPAPTAHDDAAAARAPGSSGARSRRPARSCCSRSATTSRRTSRRCRCCGSCRSRSTC